eukprot:1130053-Rhodomonas_salina.1
MLYDSESSTLAFRTSEVSGSLSSEAAAPWHASAQAQAQAQAASAAAAVRWTTSLLRLRLRISPPRLTWNHARGWRALSRRPGVSHGPEALRLPVGHRAHRARVTVTESRTRLAGP